VALSETLVLYVGPAIAKAILKRWLKDDMLAAPAGGIVDQLKAKGADWFASKKGANQLETIGANVAESLIPIFERDGGKLDEGARASVAQTLAESLEQTAITPGTLAQIDLNPKQLAVLLRDAIPNATRDYSASETMLFDSLISETSKCIIDIAAELPHFQVQTFAEVLKRENELVEIANKILREVQEIRRESDRANPDEAARRFEEDYQREVVRVLDEIKLFGVDAEETARRYRLSVAYVTLDVRQKAGKPDEADDPGYNVMSVQEALASTQRLLARGQPGSGKTTLLQWIAVRCALHDFDPALAEWNETVPFFLRLRDLSDRKLPQLDEFPCLLSPLVDAPPAGWVRAQLQSGRAVVLLDGIDEVPEARREEVRDWIRGLCEFPVRLVVTARPHAVDEGWMESDGFADAEMQEMDGALRDEFIDHWYASICPQQAQPHEQDALRGMAERLKAAIKARRALSELATNPLLCAMICLLHKLRHEVIPDNRIELYQTCVEMLLRRDAERKINLAEYPALSATQKRLLLEHLAYWMQRNNHDSAARDEARDIVAKKLEVLQNLPANADPERTLNLLTQRTGLAREPIKGKVDFTHRTFQEFFAAQAALDAEDIGLLIEHAADDRWREVILLAAGLAKGANGQRIVNQLIQSGDMNRASMHKLYLLAVACLPIVHELSSKIRSLVQNRLSHIMPPENMTDAAVIAAAGDIAIPHLVFRSGRLATTDAASVRALVQIGGDAALDALATYAKDRRQTVQTELWRGARVFNSTEYGPRILNIRNGTVHGCPLSDISILAAWKELNAVSLCGSPVYDVSPLASLTNVTSLDLSSTRVEDLTPLAQLVSLSQLNISHTRVTDLTPLMALINLTSLDLAHTQVTDITPLSALTSIAALSLSQAPITDLAALAALKELISLNLAHISVNDLTPIAGLTSLQSLNLWQVQILDLIPLAGLTSLTSLNLWRTKVCDLAPLVTLTGLTSLNLAHTRATDITPLAGLRNLTSLDLSGTSVSDLTPLAGMTNLTSLDIARTPVSDLTPLAGLTNLKSVNLWQTNVCDLSPLAALSNLHGLRLSNRAIDLRPLSALQYLTVNYGRRIRRRPARYNK
jgi:Leucine-rich repeat (LRR) protein